MSSDFFSAVIQGVETARLPATVKRSDAAETASNEGKKLSASGNTMPQESEKTEQTVADVETAVSQISDYVQSYQRNLEFSVDTDSGRTIIKVVDSVSQEVIRTIPPEHVLRLAQDLDSPDSVILQEQA